MKRKSRANGVPAAAWFYAQPGFHNPLSEVDVKHEPICDRGQRCYCGTTCPECGDRDGWHRNNCKTGAERSRKAWLATQGEPCGLDCGVDHATGAWVCRCGATARNMDSDHQHALDIDAARLRCSCLEFWKSHHPDCPTRKRRNPYCKRDNCMCHEIASKECDELILEAAIYLGAHWPAYWVVMDSWPAELQRAVSTLRVARK